MKDFAHFLNMFIWAAVPSSTGILAAFAMTNNSGMSTLLPMFVGLTVGAVVQIAVAKSKIGGFIFGPGYEL